MSRSDSQPWSVCFREHLLLGPVTAVKRIGRTRLRQKTNSHPKNRENQQDLEASTETEWFLGIGIGHRLEIWREGTLELLESIDCLPSGQVVHGIESTGAPSALPWLVVFGGRYLSLCYWTVSNEQDIEAPHILHRCLTFAAEAWILTVSLEKVSCDQPLGQHQSAREPSEITARKKIQAQEVAPSNNRNGEAPKQRTLDSPQPNTVQETTTAQATVSMVLSNGCVTVLEAYVSSGKGWHYQTHTRCVLGQAHYWSAAICSAVGLVALGTADGSIWVHPWDCESSIDSRSVDHEKQRMVRTPLGFRAHRGPVYSLHWALSLSANATARLMFDETGHHLSWLCSCGDDRTVQCFRVRHPAAEHIASPSFGLQCHSPEPTVGDRAAKLDACLSSLGERKTSGYKVERLAELRGHQARPWAIRAYVFVPNTARTVSEEDILICSVGEDNTARLWDVRAARCAQIIRLHRSRNIWSLDMAPASQANDGQGRFLLWLYTGGADGTVSLHPLVWPPACRQSTELSSMLKHHRGISANQPRINGNSGTCPPEEMTTLEEELSIPAQGSLELAPPLPRPQKKCFLSGREHARAMAVLADAQLLCVSTNARRVLALDMNQMDWMELFCADADDAIDFMPDSIATAKEFPWVFLGASHRQGTILAIELDLARIKSGSYSSPVLLRSECWQVSKTLARPVTLLHLWDDQLLFAATADGTVFAFDVQALLEGNPAEHVLEPMALFTVPDDIISQPASIGVVPVWSEANDAPTSANRRASQVAVLIGHRSGQLRLHMYAASEARAGDSLPVPCIQSLRPHDDRVTSIVAMPGGDLETSFTRDHPTVFMLSMDGTHARYQLLADGASSRGMWRLVQSSREKCPIECDQGDVFYQLPYHPASDGRHQSSASLLLASGFRGHAYGVWQLETAQSLFVVPCGGWRRPHILYGRRSATAETLIGFAFWRAGKLCRFEYVMERANGTRFLPRQIRISGAAMRIQGLLVLPATMKTSASVQDHHRAIRCPCPRTSLLSQQRQHDEDDLADLTRATFWLVTASEDTTLDLYRCAVAVSAERGSRLRLCGRIASGSAGHFSGILCLAGMSWPSRRFFVDGRRADLGLPAAPTQDYLLVSGGGSDVLCFWRLSSTGLGLLARYIRSRSRAPFASGLCRPSCESLARVTAAALKPSSALGSDDPVTSLGTRPYPLDTTNSTSNTLECSLLCGRSDGTLSIYWLQVAAIGNESGKPPLHRAFFQQCAADHNWHTTMELLAVRRWRGYVYPRALCSLSFTPWFLVGDTAGTVSLYASPVAASPTSPNPAACPCSGQKDTAPAQGSCSPGAPFPSAVTALEPLWEAQAFLAAAVNALDGLCFQFPAQQPSDWLLLAAGGDDQQIRVLLCSLQTRSICWSTERIGCHTGAITGLQLRLWSKGVDATATLSLVAELWTWATDRWLQCHHIRLRIQVDQSVAEASVTQTVCVPFSTGDPATLSLAPDHSLVVISGLGVAALTREQLCHPSAFDRS
jgi:hypothetical protein